jgi:ribosome-binding protein aMBF1 (putative translation factor)
MTESSGWLADKRNDPEFQRLYAREGFIEDFLTRVELEMDRQGISRAELARRMACAPSNITQMFHRTRNLTAATMIDVAFHLKLRSKLLFDPLEQSTEGDGVSRP